MDCRRGWGGAAGVAWGVRLEGGSQRVRSSCACLIGYPTPAAGHRAAMPARFA